MSDNKVAVLQACDAMGNRINGSHRFISDQVIAVSPINDGANSLLTTSAGTQHSLLEPANEVAKLLGWE